MVSKEEVKKIYSLANLRVSDEDLDSIARKFEDVFEFANEIMNLDTENIEDLEIVVEHNCQFRDDEVKESISREEALLNAMDREYGYFRLKKVVK